jgi:hypothetical protein
MLQELAQRENKYNKEPGDYFKMLHLIKNLDSSKQSE